MRARSLLAVAALSLLAAAPARAATTIGDTTTPAGPGPGPAVFVQATDALETPYGVPAGGGVITSVSARFSGTLTFLVLRPTGPGDYEIMSKQPMNDPTTTFGVTTAAVRVPVAAGDRLGAHVPTSSAVGGSIDPVGAYVTYPATDTAPAAGTTLSGSSGGGGMARLALSAVVEPDADHDGYGDETQDQCGSDATSHDLPCTIDMSVSATATPGTIAQGDVTTIVAPITATDGPAPGAHAALVIPDGLSVIAASTTGGECDGTVCRFGNLAAGETRKAYIVVRGTAAGAHAFGVNVASAQPDANLSNNFAYAAVTVSAPPAATPPAPTTTLNLCRVPSLKNKTAAAAKTALTKAGCKAGKATGSKSKKAKVKSQTIPAGVQVAPGTKVGYALKAPAAKKKATKKKR